MKIAGMYDTEDEVYCYTDNFVDFYDKNKNKIPEEKLKEWAMYMNSPWRETGEKYATRRTNILFNEEYSWETYYRVMSRDLGCSSIYGYGDTPEESFENCISNFTKVQERYNPEGKQF